MPVTTPIPNAALQGLVLFLLVLAGCKAPQHSHTIPKGAIQLLRFEVPASLARERGLYEEDVQTALGDVSTFFHAAGIELPDQRIIDSVTVFDSSQEAREYLANAYGAPVESIPETFSGTVEGTRLFLVSRDIYREIWHKLYPEWPWTEQTYHQLIVHELAHRAHEAIALSRYGSADAMGPTWFFEGLAVTCAGQFEKGTLLFNREELQQQVGSGHTPDVSYPLYGRIVRSLAAEFGLEVLVAKASEPGFPETLWAPHDTKQPQGR